MKIEIESEALDSLKAMAQRLQTERDELMLIVLSFMEVCDAAPPVEIVERLGAAYKKANAVIVKLTAKPEILA